MTCDRYAYAVHLAVLSGMGITSICLLKYSMHTMMYLLPNADVSNGPHKSTPHLNWSPSIESGCSTWSSAEKVAFTVLRVVGVDGQ